MPSFYEDQNFLTTLSSVDLTIMNHFSNLLLLGELDRVVYSRDAYAFRERSNKNKGKLELPFINLKLTDYSMGLREWWNQTAYAKGLYIDELGDKIMFAPITLSYECTFWCHREDELRYAFTQVIADADNKTILQPSITILEKEVAFPALLGYNSPVFEPEYTEHDWLEKNKIHSASLPFNLDSFVLKIDGDEVFWIPETLVLNFANAIPELTGTTYNETYQFVIDHVNETIT